MKVNIDKAPDVVSHRNHFETVDTIVDRYIIAHRLPEEHRALLLAFAHRLMIEVEHAFTTGAERGVRQAGKLLRDPEYTAKLRERRKRIIERFKLKREKQRTDGLLDKAPGTLQ